MLFRSNNTYIRMCMGGFMVRVEINRYRTGEYSCNGLCILRAFMGVSEECDIVNRLM